MLDNNQNQIPLSVVLNHSSIFHLHQSDQILILFKFIYLHKHE